jgi:hypothetical protein
VANVYYAQPLLDALANDFGISHAAVGGVVTATQIGCALALLLVVPLGDKVDRRRLMAVQLIALVVALVSVSMAQSSSALLIGMLATGMLGTAMTQGLIAYAASAASPHEQGALSARHRAACSQVCCSLASLPVASAISRAGAGLSLRCRADAHDCVTSVVATPRPASRHCHDELSAPDWLNAHAAAAGKSAADTRRAGAADVCIVQHFLERTGAAAERTAV